MAIRTAQSGQQAQLAELDNQIELAAQRLNRLQQLAGSVAASIAYAYFFTHCPPGVLT